MTRQIAVLAIGAGWAVVAGRVIHSAVKPAHSDEAGADGVALVGTSWGAR